MRFRIRFRFVRRVAVSAARARIRRVAARRTRRLRHFRFVIVSQRLFADLWRIFLHLRRTAHFARVQHARRIFARRFRMHAFVVLVSQRFRVFLFRVVAAAALQRIMPAFFARRRYIPFVLRIQLQVVTQSFAARYHFRLAFLAAHRALLSDLRRFRARRFDHGHFEIMAIESNILDFSTRRAFLLFDASHIAGAFFQHHYIHKCMAESLFRLADAKKQTIFSAPHHLAAAVTNVGVLLGLLTRSFLINHALEGGVAPIALLALRILTQPAYHVLMRNRTIAIPFILSNRLFCIHSHRHRGQDHAQSQNTHENSPFHASHPFIRA